MGRSGRGPAVEGWEGKPEEAPAWDDEGWWAGRVTARRAQPVGSALSPSSKARLKEKEEDESRDQA